MSVMHLSLTKTQKTSLGWRFPEPVWQTPAIAAHARWATTETQSAFQRRPNLTFAARRPAIFVRVFNAVLHHTGIKLEFDSKRKIVQEVASNWEHIIWQCDGFGLTKSLHKNVATCQFWDHTKKGGKISNIKNQYVFNISKKKNQLSESYWSTKSILFVYHQLHS